MRRRTIITFAVVSTLLLFFSGPPLLYPGPHSPLMYIILVVSGLITLPPWISALWETAKGNHWLWFAGLPLLAPLAPIIVLLYGIAGPNPQRLLARVS